MKTKLTLERLDRNRRLLERREQLSRSFTLEFLKVLYVQHAQATYNSIGTSESNLYLAAPPGYEPWSIGLGEYYGIVVGEGSPTPAPDDLTLLVPICHGKIYKGTPAQFTNPSFETGDFTGWTTGNSPSVQSGGFVGSTGSYYCKFSGSATRYISQDLDVTNIARIVFALGSSHAGYHDTTRLRVYVGANLVYEFSHYESNRSPHLVAIDIDYSGVQTVKFEYYGNGDCNLSLDAIQTYGKELEYSGSEVLLPAFSDPDGELALRRFFTNNSGNSITVNEAGMVTYPGRLIVHDAVSPGIAIADTELLKVTYTMGITV